MWEAITAISGMCTTVIAVFGLYYIRQTYHQTVGAVDAAKGAVEISERTLLHTQGLGFTQNRAWLHLEKIELGEMIFGTLAKNGEPTLGITVDYTLANTGATPALKCMVSGTASNDVADHDFRSEMTSDVLATDDLFSVPPRGKRDGSIWIQVPVESYGDVSFMGLNFGLFLTISYNVNGSDQSFKTMYRLPVFDGYGGQLDAATGRKSFDSIESYLRRRRSIVPNEHGSQFEIMGIGSEME